MKRCVCNLDSWNYSPRRHICDRYFDVGTGFCYDCNHHEGCHNGQQVWIACGKDNPPPNNQIMLLLMSPLVVKDSPQEKIEPGMSERYVVPVLDCRTMGVAGVSFTHYCVIIVPEFPAE